MVQENRIRFADRYTEGVVRARRENKPLMVVFVETGCVFSRMMDEKTFVDSRIIELSKNFVCVRVEMSRRESNELCEEMKIKGSPTIQFLTPSGTPLQRLAQYRSSDELAHQMEVVLYSVAWRESAQIR